MPRGRLPIAIFWRTVPATASITTTSVPVSSETYTRGPAVAGDPAGAGAAVDAGAGALLQAVTDRLRMAAAPAARKRARCMRTRYPAGMAKDNLRTRCAMRNDDGAPPRRQKPHFVT